MRAAHMLAPCPSLLVSLLAFAALAFLSDGAVLRGGHDVISIRPDKGTASAISYQRVQSLVATMRRLRAIGHLPAAARAAAARRASRSLVNLEGHGVWHMHGRLPEIDQTTSVPNQTRAISNSLGELENKLQGVARKLQKHRAHVTTLHHSKVPGSRRKKQPKIDVIHHAKSPARTLQHHFVAHKTLQEPEDSAEPAPSAVASVEAETTAPNTLEITARSYGGFDETMEVLQGMMREVEAKRTEEHIQCTVNSQTQVDELQGLNQRATELSNQAADAPQDLVSVETDVQYLTLEIQTLQNQLQNFITKCGLDLQNLEAELQGVADHKAIVERLVTNSNCDSEVGDQIPDCVNLENHVRTLEAGVADKEAELSTQINSTRLQCTQYQANRTARIAELQDTLVAQRGEAAELAETREEAQERAEDKGDDIQHLEDAYRSNLQRCQTNLAAYDAEIARLKLIKSDLDELLSPPVVGVDAPGTVDINIPQALEEYAPTQAPTAAPPAVAVTPPVHMVPGPSEPQPPAAGYAPPVQNPILQPPPAYAAPQPPVAAEPPPTVAMPPLASQPPVAVQPPVSSQTPTAAQPPVYAQPPANQPPVYAPPVDVYPAPIVQAPLAQPPSYTQPPVVSQPPPVAGYVQPPVAAQPPVAGQPPVYSQPPVAAQPPVYSQPPVIAQPPAYSQPPVAAEQQPPASEDPTVDIGDLPTLAPLSAVANVGPVHQELPTPIPTVDPSDLPTLAPLTAATEINPAQSSAKSSAGGETGDDFPPFEDDPDIDSLLTSTSWNGAH